MNETNAAPWFRFAPAGAGRGARAGFAVLALLSLAVSIALPGAVTRLILYRQERLEENRIEAALATLRGGGDEAAARRKIAAVLETKIERKFEGSGRAVLAPQYAEIARRCLERGWNDEAREMALKSIRHYHRVSRGLGYLEPWLVLERIWHAADFGRFMQVFDYIVSHSIESNRPFFELLQGRRDPLASPLYRYADMREKFNNLKASNRRLNLANYRIAADQFELRYRVERMRVKNAIEKGDGPDAVQKASTFARQNLAEIRASALAARSIGRGDAAIFADGLAKSAPAHFSAVNFRKAAPVATEYEAPVKIERAKDGSAALRAVGAVKLPFEISKPAKALHLAASGTDCLDVFPMLLVSIDGGEPAPVYVDSREPELYSIPAQLAPGTHEISIEYLNDFARTIGGRDFDRNLRLHRLLIEHDAPAAPDAKPEAPANPAGPSKS